MAYQYNVRYRARSLRSRTRSGPVCTGRGHAVRAWVAGCGADTSRNGTRNRARNSAADISIEEPPVLRLATKTDEAAALVQRERLVTEFDEWVERIQRWKLDIELLDIERTLDEEKQILFVLNDQGPDCTKLALYAAAEAAVAEADTHRNFSPSLSS
jgi:hypothetical protein